MSVQVALGDPLTFTVSQLFSFEELWGEVERNCNRLFEDLFTSDVAEIVQEVTTAYTLVYHLCSHPCRINNVRVDNTAQLQYVERQLEGLLVARVKASRKRILQSDDLVQTYINEWRVFLVSVTQLITIFTPIHVTAGILSQNAYNFERTDALAFLKWSEYVLSPELEAALKQFVKSVIQDDRSGKDAPLFSLVTELKDELVMLPDSTKYKNIIETDYINDMCAFYRQMMSSWDIRDYPAFCQKCLQQYENEQRRTDKFLISGEAAMRELIRVFVNENVDSIPKDAIVTMIRAVDENGGRENLRHVFTLLCKSQYCGLPLLQSALHEAIVQVLQTQLTACRSQNNPYSLVVVTFTKLFTYFSDLLVDVFDGHPSLSESLKSGLHRGLVEGVGPLDFSVLAERLAVLSSRLFSVPTPSNLIVDQIQMLGMFYFLPDGRSSAKDVFLKTHQGFLAHRLLSGSFDLSLEKDSLDHMAKIKLSPILFRCRSMLETTVRGTIYITVGRPAAAPIITLRTGLWHMYPSQTPLRLDSVPQSIRDDIASAEATCRVERPGQVAQLLENTSKCIIRLRNTEGDMVRTQVSLSQLAMLQVFQTRAQCSVADLCAVTGLARAECICLLNPLLTAGILSAPAASTLTGDSLVSRSTCTLPSDGKLARLLTSPHVEDAAVVTEKTLGTRALPQADSQVIDSQIVQLLKKHGSRTFDELMEGLLQVLPQLLTQVEDVKHSLEKLITREFVRRNAAPSGSHVTFSFVP